jgi:hypothetical protein
MNIQFIKTECTGPAGSDSKRSNSGGKEMYDAGASDDKLELQADPANPRGCVLGRKSPKDAAPLCQRRLGVIKRHSDISVVSPDGTVIVFVTARGGAAHLP